MAYSIKGDVIVFARLSRTPDSSRGVLSLQSQRYAIENFMKEKGLSMFCAYESIGSAYKTGQDDLKKLVRSSRRKNLMVYEANRLSRNVENFNAVWEICRRNKHTITVVNIDRTFSPEVAGDYEALLELIKVAEKESRDMGARISRTAKYKKSMETKWGMMRNEFGEIVENPNEKKITKLIKLLGTRGSNVSEIKALIEELGEMEGKEPFELLDCDEDGMEKSVGRILPYAMDINNIVETLKIYEIKKRRARWSIKDVSDVLVFKPF
jgi:DNA invertase Pin-like site-specific DNA recombinase